MAYSTEILGAPASAGCRTNVDVIAAYSRRQAWAITLLAAPALLLIEWTANPLYVAKGRRGRDGGLILDDPRGEGVRATFSDFVERLHYGKLIWIAVGAVAVLVVVEVTLRYIANRRQPGSPADLVAADDALRSTSMHATIGAGLALAFLLAGGAFAGIGLLSDIQILRWAAVPLAFGSMIAAVVAWLELGHDTPWVVRRSTTAPTVHA